MTTATLPAARSMNPREFDVSECDSHHESQLVSRLKQGDQAAYEMLVQNHCGRMLTVARRFLRSEDDCHDAVQDAFLSAFRALNSFERGSTLRTWLHRITVNACLMKLRSQKRRRTVSIDDLFPSFDETRHRARAVAACDKQPHDPVFREEIKAQVHECIDLLPDAYRDILLMRDIEEFDTVQTSILLGISTEAVKTRLHRARQALRSLLAPLQFAEKSVADRTGFNSVSNEYSRKARPVMLR